MSRLLYQSLAMSVLPAALAGWSLAEAPRSGEQMFRQRCADCHGPSGEGTKANYPHPLIGEKSVGELARLIAKTMPADDPGSCSPADAELVATYIYESFYSPAAQSRRRPRRIELSRLTVRQYQNVLADLFGSFRGSMQIDQRQGLHAEYYKSGHFSHAERVLERLDPTIEFTPDSQRPLPAGMSAETFSICWQGTLLAPDTGVYDFIVSTENGARLWVNDLQRPLIDAWVSGGDREHRESIRLLGGRRYSLRLECFKAKESKQKTLSIQLKWKPPRQAVDVIPARHLSPGRAAEVFVVTKSFPPDDRSVGYERGTAISKAWDLATTEAALEASAYAASQWRPMLGPSDDPVQRERRLRQFCLQFAERAFRQPLSAEWQSRYIDRQFTAAGNPEAALKRVVLLVLKSPRFLYREIGEGPAAYDVAARLALALWDSLPDDPLLRAAAAGRLATRSEVARQAERMAADPRAQAKLREFFLQWLKVDQAADLGKDSARFPDFTPSVASDLRTSLDLFLADVLGSPGTDLRQLLLADYVYLNGRLAGFFGAKLQPDAPFQKVVLDPGQRAGVVSHPYLMAYFAYTGTSSPIHRGVFLTRSVLGRSLRPPPIAVAPLAADLNPDLTTRQRVLLQTQPAACQTCHAMINPLGFGLENFDAVGRFRRDEKGHPIDATGSYQQQAGDLVRFAGARDLAMFLAGSQEVHAAFVEQLFHYTVKQPIRAFGPHVGDDLQRTLADQQFNIRKLLIEIATIASLHKR